MKQQSGFTLIELIAVIVILGIIAATAVPRFVDLSEAARDAAVQGTAGSLGSAAALNHANSIAKKAGLDTEDPINIENCDQVNRLLEGGLPDNYIIKNQSIAAGASEECIVGYDENGENGLEGSEVQATFAAYGVANGTDPTATP